MESTTEDRRQELVRKIESLPEDLQEAVIWVIDYDHFAEQMCRAEPLNEERRAALQRQAIEQGDAWLCVLLALERTINAER